MSLSTSARVWAISRSSSPMSWGNRGRSCLWTSRSFHYVSSEPGASSWEIETSMRFLPSRMILTCLPQKSMPCWFSNTYHELTHPALILDQLSRSLKPGGHLVIVDRGPSAGHETGKSEDHAVASEEVEAT